MTRNYEIRVEGELGGTLLRYLRCPHRMIPEETVLRVNATSAELARLLRACSEHGLTIERVTRISRPSVASPPAVTD
jgi:hypothetical protein